MKRAKIFITVLIFFSAMLNDLSWGAAQKPKDNPGEDREQERLFLVSLDDVTRLAFKNNFDIQLARYDAQIARTGEGVAESIYDTFLTAEVAYRNNQMARTSTLLGSKTVDNDYNIGLSKKLPLGTTLSVDMTNNRSWNDSSFVTTNPSHDSSLGVTVQQALGRNFLGLQDRNAIKITRLDIENSGYLSLDRIEQTLGNVQKAYWALVLAVEQMNIEREMVNQARKLKDLQEEKLKVGLSESPEVFASQANYRMRLNELQLAQNNVETQMNTLKLLLNIEDDHVRLMPLDVFSAVRVPQNVASSLKRAFENRRDYKRALNDVTSRHLNISMKENSLWPEINLTASLTRNGLGDHFKKAVENITDENNPEIYAGIVFSFPMENTKARSERTAAELEKARALVNLKLTERTISVEIVDQVRTCNVFQKVALSNQDVVKLQKKKLHGEERRFKTGRSDTDTVIRFQQDLLSARLNAVQSMFNYHAAFVDLQQKEGTLLGKYMEKGSNDYR